MLSEIKNLCKRAVEWIKTNNKELYLAIVIVLVATISFGLGRLSKIRDEKTPITIEDGGLNPLSTLNVNSVKIPNKNGAENTLQHNSSTISQSQKIFVASRNGKKYYYAWCDSAKVIKETNRVWFSTEEEAKKSGYQPAENCKGLK